MDPPTAFAPYVPIPLLALFNDVALQFEERVLLTVTLTPIAVVDPELLLLPPSLLVLQTYAPM